ncbi:YwnF family protein [Mesobacillus maritimus]|uniref:YwnF family protein n=1 Tax=Mesobacillus maritimus TaxID=1643336 RepID=UPI00384A921B
MVNMKMPDMPNHVKKEIEKLQEILNPFMKKVAKYSMWTLPLVVFSFFNLLNLIYFGALNRDNLPIILFFAFTGAIGMALYKEVRIQRKEIQKISAKYIIERIKKSEIATESHKNQYIALVKEQSIGKMMNHFIMFLNEEENRRRLLN